MTVEVTAPYIDRIIDLPARLAKKSHFLLGPRQTGKSFFIANTLVGVTVLPFQEFLAALWSGEYA